MQGCVCCRSEPPLTDLESEERVCVRVCVFCTASELVDFVGSPCWKGQGRKCLGGEKCQAISSPRRASSDNDCSSAGTTRACVLLFLFFPSSFSTSESHACTLSASCSLLSFFLEPSLMRYGDSQPKKMDNRTCMPSLKVDTMHSALHVWVCNFFFSLALTVANQAHASAATLTECRWSEC